jgi:hypothetical protein
LKYKKEDPAMVQWTERLAIFTRKKEIEVAKYGGLRKKPCATGDLYTLRRISSTSRDQTGNLKKKEIRRVLHEIPSRGLNQGKNHCVPCALSVMTKENHLSHLPNNLGGESPGVRRRTRDNMIKGSMILFTL